MFYALYDKGYDKGKWPCFERFGRNSHAFGWGFHVWRLKASSQHQTFSSARFVGMADKNRIWKLLKTFQPLHKFKEDVSDHLPRIAMNGVGEDSERVPEGGDFQ